MVDCSTRAACDRSQRSAIMPPINTVMCRFTGQDYLADGSQEKKHFQSRSPKAAAGDTLAGQLHFQGFELLHAESAFTVSGLSGLTPEDDENINALRNRSLAESTRQNYGYQWKRFTRWALKRGENPLPASAELVAAYIAERSAKGDKPSTLKTAACAITHYHRSAGVDDPCSKLAVRDVLSGAARGGKKQTQAKVLRAEELVKIQLSACVPRRSRGGGMETNETAEKRGKLDIAIISLMRDGMLRVSEAADLVWEDIRDYGDGTGRVHIRKSKTDQEGAGAVGFLSIQTMVMLNEIRGIMGPALPSDRVFGLCRKAISERIKKAALAAGLGEGFSAHSTRVGMARDLARFGAELPEMMHAGRWSSPEMVSHYIREEEAGRNVVARYYGYDL